MGAMPQPMVVAPVFVPAVGEPEQGAGGPGPQAQPVAPDRAMLHGTEMTRTYPCSACGAQLVFDPAGQDLLCPSCGNRSPVTAPNVPVQARELGPAMAALRELQGQAAGPRVTGEWEVKCQNCGGTTGFNGSLTATRCPYCATPIQRDDVHNAPARLPVDGVVPFLVGEKQARELVEKWVSKRWFAPSNFRKYRRIGAFSSLYTAYFTYDADTASWYQGERGDDYQVRVGTDEDGDPIYETHTRWHSVAGEVGNEFADLPVLANENLNRDRIRSLEPWPVEQARAYSPEFVAGHLCRTYDKDAEESFPEAQQRIESAIESSVRADIGGDHQRIHELNTNWNWLAYKHVLLPIWLLTVVYMDKTYQVYINGLTGQVSGDRPWSKAKIIAAIVAVLAVIVAVVVAFAVARGHHTPSRHPSGPSHSTVVPTRPTTHR
ncbi:hypothetical protein ACQP06_20550 [Nocardia sp. CA-136227]|uniref:hypothetical protein n=1 Tax=Nocardia sp. CA-136227 TaxID=3239979 RepID=UPI003D9522D2